MSVNSAKTAQWAESVAQNIRLRTGGQVRDVCVEVGPDAVRVRGLAPSFYLKQLTLEAARASLRGAQLKLRLEITVHER
jgi:hypothetical protein